MNKKGKNQQKSYIDQNPVESIFNLGQDVASSIVSDVVKPSFTDLWEQLLGAETPQENKSTGDLEEGQELDLKNLNKQETGLANVEAGIDYAREIVHTEVRTERENREISFRIEEILVEIKKLTDASSELALEFKDVIIEQPIVNPGKYHENFLEWVFAAVKNARMRVEESVGWLSVMSGKKNKKDYWSMFKKHGTTFGMSNERMVSTQTG